MKHFKENRDFTSVLTSTVVNNGAVRQLEDYALTLDVAKHLAMVSVQKKVLIRSISSK
ncbi:antA/AntB antirepressor family protein [Staphylococcus aureus]